MEDNVLRPAVRGGVSSLTSQVLSRGVGLLATTIMAALLTPTDFGLVAIALLCVTAVNVTTGFGLGPAVLAGGRGTVFDRTAATWALGTGVLGGCLLLVGAPLAARLLGNPLAAPYVAAVAPVLALQQWIEFRIALFDRSLRFTFTNALRAGGAITGAAAGVTAAWLGFGAWALVVQILTAQVVLAVAVTANPFGTRRPGWDAASARRLWGFGRQLAVTDVALVIYTNLDDAIVSRVAGTSLLGVYTFVYKISNAPFYALTQPVSRLSLALYVRLSEGHSSLSSAYLGILKMIAWLGGAVGISLLFFGPPLMDWIYGGRWSAGYDTLRILSVFGIFRSINNASGPLLVAMDQPRVLRVVTQWQTIAMAAIVYPMVQALGIEGAALAVTGPMAVATVVNVARSSRIAGLPAPRALRGVALPWLAIGVACSVGLAVGSMVASYALGLSLVVSLALTGAAGTIGMRREVAMVVKALRPTP